MKSKIIKWHPLKGKLTKRRVKPIAINQTKYSTALRGRNSNMGQSLVKNFIHIIFSTKGRKPMILPPFESLLHSYLGGICKKHDCTPIAIGGFVDHIHVLCLLSKKVTLVSLLEELKSSSSKWMKSQDYSLKDFYWQDGYGAFSVNPSQVGTVVEYIRNQHEHHRKKTFQIEYRSFLKKYKVEYDERYVWD